MRMQEPGMRKFRERPYGSPDGLFLALHGGSSYTCRSRWTKPNGAVEGLSQPPDFTGIARTKSCPWSIVRLRRRAG